MIGGSITRNQYGFNKFLDNTWPFFPRSFRENVRQFLHEYVEMQDYRVKGMVTWCFNLIEAKRGLVIPVYTIEDRAQNGSQPCHHCHSSGNSMKLWIELLFLWFLIIVYRVLVSILNLVIISTFSWIELLLLD